MWVLEVSDVQTTNIFVNDRKDEFLRKTLYHIETSNKYFLQSLVCTPVYQILVQNN